MDRSEWFLAIIAYMLAVLIFTLEADNVDLAIIPILAVLFGLPIYVVAHLLNGYLDRSGQ